MNFPPAVEQWRPLVAKYFPANLVDKALWTIQYESGGNPTIPGDNGVAHGLFQIQDNNAFMGRPTAEWLNDPENNIVYAANQLGAASGNFSAWGENNTYNGQTFGALGNHPFPGNGASGMTVASGGANGFVPAGWTWVDNPVFQGGGYWLKENGLVWNGQVTKSPKGTDIYGGAETPQQAVARLTGVWPNGTPYVTGDYATDATAAASSANAQRTRADITNPTPDSAASVAATIRGQDIGAETTRRGQDITAATTQRGQDITTGTAANGQAVTQRGQDLDYQARLAQIAQSKYDSDLRYQQGMAAATNEQQKQQIEAQWYAEQAAIEQMKNQTTLLLGQQSNQVKQYGDELNHAYQMGTLGLDTDKFIADMATRPRNLPALFMMQRGYTPDWQTMINGGTPAQGQALVPVNPMSAWTGTTKPVDFTQPLVNPYTDRVGAAMQAGIAASHQANPFISATPRASYTPPSATLPPQVPGYTPPPQVTPPAASGSPASPSSGGFNWDSVRLGEYGVDNRAIPNSANSWTGYTGGAGPSSVSDYGGWNVVNSATGRPWDANTPIGPSSMITLNRAMASGAGVPPPATQVAQPGSGLQTPSGIQGPPAEQGGGPGGLSPRIPGVRLPNLQGATVPGILLHMAYGGMTRARNLMVGDAAAPDPNAGGALPEIIQNPTGAPLNVIPNQQNVQAAMPAPDPVAQMNQVLMGLGKRVPMRRFALGTPGTFGSGSVPTGMDPNAPKPGDPMGRTWGQWSGGNYFSSPPPAQAAPTYQWDTPLPGKQGWGTKGGPPPVATPNQSWDTGPTTPIAPVSYGSDTQSHVLPAGTTTVFGAPTNSPVTNLPYGNDNQTHALPPAPAPVINPTPTPGVVTPPAPVSGLTNQAAQNTYNQLGMGGYWVPNSNNSYANSQPSPMPQALATLAAYGFPVAPSLYSAATGSDMPRNDLANAFNRLGGGILPSLQTLNAMSGSEQDLYGPGYAQGIVGVPWSDLVQYIAQGTKGLGNAAEARGAFA